MQPAEAPSPQSSARTSAPLAADVLARGLRAAGVEFAFGVPGGEVLRLIEALGLAGIPFRAARHENAAAFMAIGAHRAGQGLGLVVATLGPGVANLPGAAAHALQDDVPLVILGGRVALDAPREFRHQIIDQTALFGPVTKGVFTLRASAAAEIAAGAIALALAEPRGPVYIDCPQDEVEKVANAVAAGAFTPGTGESAAVASVDPLVRSLDRSRRPLVLVGQGAIRPGVAEALGDLIARRRMPVLSTYKAKGVFPETDAVALGAAGLSPLADAELLPFVARADLVLLVGYDPVEMRSNWNRPFAPDAEVWSLGPAATRRAGPIATDQIVGPLALILERLTAGIEARPIDPGLRAEVVELRRRAVEIFTPRSEWEPAALFETLHEILGDEDLVTVDTGAHRILLAQQWRMSGPGRLLQSSGFCTMACALPMAIGAKLAAPSRRVVAVVGDGGLEMGAGELATLRDLGDPLTLVVVDDGGYALIDMKQRSRGFPGVGVDFGRTDFVALARAFGGHGQAVGSRAELRRALGEALERTSSFSLIHAPFPRRSYDERI